MAHRSPEATQDTCSSSSSPPPAPAPAKRILSLKPVWGPLVGHNGPPRRAGSSQIWVCFSSTTPLPTQHASRLGAQSSILEW